jgi:hypothetical protein
MGSSNSRFLEILVLGLPGVGKTYFLDMLFYEQGITKPPTNGYNEVRYKYKEHLIHFVEFGGKNNWELMIKQLEIKFDCIYFIVPGESPQEIQWESASAAISMQSKLKLPIAFIKITWNNRDDDPYKICLGSAKFRRCFCTINYNNPAWEERVSRLLEWTIEGARLNSANDLE